MGCLSTASQIGLFNESTLQTGNRTPQVEPNRGAELQPARVDETDQEDQSTVILSRPSKDNGSDVLMEGENTLFLLRTN